jgi:hypothetical protein
MEEQQVHGQLELQQLEMDEQQLAQQSTGKRRRRQQQQHWGQLQQSTLHISDIPAQVLGR